MHLTRRDVFAPAEELRDGDPVRRAIYAEGHEGWLVTGFHQVRAVLADNRFSARADLQRSLFTKDVRLDFPAGFFSRLDEPEHTYYRRLLTGQFTVSRMRRLEIRIAEIVEERLDAMTAPADLVQDFALPIPSLMICELLGVPYADCDLFQRRSAMMFNLQAPREERDAAMQHLFGYLRDLVVRKRGEPADILSGLVGEALSDEEITGMALLLLMTGHETTANALTMATFALLQHPDQIELMKQSPHLAVEELLRYLSLVFAIGRTALEDVELDGHLIKAGESVTLSLAGANRDVTRFAAPDVLDVIRQATGHLALGHGAHQCLGQQLARVEMRIALPALFTRFPTLTLAVPPEEVPMRLGSVVYGAHRLPVTW